MIRDRTESCFTLSIHGTLGRDRTESCSTLIIHGTLGREGACKSLGRSGRVFDVQLSRTKITVTHLSEAHFVTLLTNHNVADLHATLILIQCVAHLLFGPVVSIRKIIWWCWAIQFPLPISLRHCWFPVILQVAMFPLLKFF